jgi:plasmid stability protein
VAEATGRFKNILTYKRFNVIFVLMSRATLYIEETIHKALRLKAAETRQSMSDLVNDALKASLLEDLEDLRDIKMRRKEKTVGFEEFLENLQSDGII